MKKNLVVVGGGTAGWLTALAAQKNYPEDNVIVIQSKEIGILGAGEGSTPSLVAFLDKLNIPFSDLVKNTNSTVKTGILFTNWSEQKSKFFHGFSSDDIFLTSIDGSNSTIPYHFLKAYLEFGNLDFINLQALLGQEYKVPFSKNNKKESINNPILQYDQFSNWAIHFDAVLFSRFLSKIGKDRGVKVIEDTVETFEVNDQEEITKLITASKKEIKTDFVFDATGFSKLFIGNHFKSKWISFKEILPTDRALSFFLEIEDKIPPYTEAITMDYGWTWKIPLQNRYGCGYVYSSKFLTEDQAKSEIIKKFGKNIQEGRLFKFTPGVFEEIWKKNVLAVGLASSFLEPLEATSLFQTTTMLDEFFSLDDPIQKKDPIIKSFLNRKYVLAAENIANFLYLHYVTGKNNTKFWKNFSSRNNAPLSIKYLLELGDITIPSVLDISLFIHNTFLYFSEISYYTVLFGNKLLNKNTIKTVYERYYNSYLEENYSTLTLNNENKVNECVDHTEFLLSLKNE